MSKVTSRPEKSGFPMDKCSSNCFYSLIRPISCLVVKEITTWEDAGKLFGIKVEKPTFAGRVWQGYEITFIPINFLNGHAMKNVSKHNGRNCNNNQSISLALCVVLRFEYSFCKISAQNEPY